MTVLDGFSFGVGLVLASWAGQAALTTVRAAHVEVVRWRQRRYESKRKASQP